MKQNIYDNAEFFQQYESIREREYNYNNLLEQPNFLTLVPDLKEKIVLDIGCGMGDFAASCIKQGAKKVTGIDISSNMIMSANRRYKEVNLDFQNKDIEDFTTDEGSIDFISSSLAFHYIERFDELIQKISKTLKEDGILLFSIEHPFVTANKGFKDRVVDSEGKIQHFVLDHYHNEGLRSQNWLVENVITYHRTFSTIINTLTDHDLIVQRIIEPLPTAEAMRKLPGLKKETRRPPFLIVRAKK
ncbi:class I SAM-dependent methyltransferase [Bacillus mesophilum]|uniref:Class I SAM-dependent methyltransferase n=1 Tax=Bacillus mesophilum TaxID=1071718 RepID=A0A7V7RJ59_9BACI|nr:class I SAM-dependent methyltransferase [Bacillus mesophilum]KAB2330701.1 class I SAM-dependent methyltransferase [Bacillus mesophilum]